MNAEQIVENITKAWRDGHAHGTSAGYRDALRDAVKAVHNMRLDAISARDYDTANTLSPVCDLLFAMMKYDN